LVATFTPWRLNLILMNPYVGATLFILLYFGLLVVAGTLLATGIHVLSGGDPDVTPLRHYIRFRESFRRRKAPAAAPRPATNGREAS
jgi:hypothetical protein